MGSYRKGLMLSLGLVTTQVDLHSVAEPKRSPLHRYCAEHHARLEQQYICKAEGEVVSDYVQGAEGPSTIRLVEKDDKPEFLKDEKLELTPVPVKDLEAHTFPQGGMYYCQPSSAATSEAWSLFKQVLDKHKTAFIAQGSLRNGERKLWRLMVFNDYLVLQELRYPEAARPVPGVQWGSEFSTLPKPSREHSKLMNQLVEQAAKPWGDVNLNDPNKEQWDKWMRGAIEIDRTDTKEETPVVSMMDALRASIDATKAS